MEYYFVTFTSSGGLTEDHCAGLKSLFQSLFEEFVGIKEHHKSGGLHLHVWYCSPLKHAAKISQRFERWYKKLSIPYVKGVSIRNKRECNRIGLCHYFVKEAKDPYFIRKFEWTWLQEQAREDVKNKPKKLLLSEERIVGQYEAVTLCTTYARATGRTIRSKNEFIVLVCDMTQQKYRFDKCRLKPIYISVLARSNDLRPAHSWFASELQGLE